MRKKIKKSWTLPYPNPAYAYVINQDPSDIWFVCSCVILPQLCYHQFVYQFYISLLFRISVFLHVRMRRGDILKFLILSFSIWRNIDKQRNMYSPHVSEISKGDLIGMLFYSTIWEAIPPNPLSGDLGLRIYIYGGHRQ